MERNTWKQEERNWATRLGGVRVPVTGRQTGSAPDVQHQRYAIEVKMGKVMSPRLQKGWFQAFSSSCFQLATQSIKKIPLLCITQTNGPGRQNSRFVMLRWEDFKDMNDFINQRDEEFASHMNDILIEELKNNK